MKELRELYLLLQELKGSTGQLIERIKAGVIVPEFPDIYKSVEEVITEIEKVMERE